MSGLALKFLGHCGKRAVRMTVYNAVRMSSTDEPCGPKQEKQQEPCTSKPPDPCAPKQEEPCPPKPDPTCSKPIKICNEPPPCPTMPRCPSTICPPIMDRNNPCNYCPPVCIDPDYPDLTRLKKFQCLFQQDDGIPIFLKRGNLDAFLYQTTVILTLVTFITSIYLTVKLMIK